MAIERTFVILKPDCMHKGLYPAVTARFVQAGFTLKACKLAKLEPGLLRTHYAHIVDKPFYPDVEAYMTSCPVLLMVWEGDGVIEKMRKLLGPTDSHAAPAGTIRGDMGVDKSTNVAHASDGPETAAEEIARFFAPEDVH
ncbi:MAG: nucleoside-diphosphate kinase [Opitutales bacterium]